MNGFQPGEEVRLVNDIVNDGTLYGHQRGETIQKTGDTGFIKQQGWFLDDLVYDVHFIQTDQIIGCREKEIIPIASPWAPPIYAKGQGVKSRLRLTQKGTTLVDAGVLGQVKSRRYDKDMGYLYHVLFENDENIYVLLESQLETP